MCTCSLQIVHGARAGPFMFSSSLITSSLDSCQGVGSLPHMRADTSSRTYSFAPEQTAGRRTPRRAGRVANPAGRGRAKDYTQVDTHRLSESLTRSPYISLHLLHSHATRHPSPRCPPKSAGPPNTRQRATDRRIRARSSRLYFNGWTNGGVELLPRSSDERVAV